jgi:hypothetical protein
MSGGNMAGWSLYLNGGRPTFHYNWFGHEHSVAMASAPLDAGLRQVVAEFAYDGGFGQGGELVLSVDGSPVAPHRPHRAHRVLDGETFDVGIDTGAPVGYTASVHRGDHRRHARTARQPSADVLADRAGEFAASLSAVTSSLPPLLCRGAGVNTR